MHACSCVDTYVDVCIYTREQVDVDGVRWVLSLFDGIVGDILGMAPAAFLFFLVYVPCKARLLHLGLVPTACHLLPATSVYLCVIQIYDM